MVQISHLDSSIQVTLPPYTKAAPFPNQDYNNIEKATFTRLINEIYEEIVKWKKNLFLIPTGQCGKDFIKLKTTWIKHATNNGDTFQKIALKVFNILPSMLLQKPSATSKAKEHSKALQQRLEMWNDGKIEELLRDNRIIQKKLSERPNRTARDVTRVFTKLIFEGKIGAAMKYLDENAENAVLQSTPEVIEKLRTLHPQPGRIYPETLLQGPLPLVSTAHFNNITEEEIMKAAQQTKGSGGPSHLDAKQWKRMLCSNHFKAENKELREQLAIFAKQIATEVVDPEILETYIACRLIPLDKDPGSPDLQIRPIGVGEVLRRIVGKTIMWSLHDEIQQAAGPLQVSSGLKGGAEAAIHSMKLKFESEATDAIILVDAANAFNQLNRLVALHNIQYICPPFAIVLINTYRVPARLFIVGGGEIESAEGNTQGCTLASAFYGLGTKPIIEELDQLNTHETPDVSQAWFADDATGAGKLVPLKVWWDTIQKEGVRYGYFVKPSKSWLILKDPQKLEECRELFADSPINITLDGKRHLGAALGSNNFKNEYIDDKVQKWVRSIQILADIAKTEPHAAYAAFIHGEQHKYTYFLRTIADISGNLKPLDEAIDNIFIPALFGTEITSNERDLLSLPIKEGGLGIRKIAGNADNSYKVSVKVTSPLTRQIIEQSDQLPTTEEVFAAKSEAILESRRNDRERHDQIKSSQEAKTKRLIEQLSEPGASSWLGAIPLASQGFNLTKGEFQDALAIRYNKHIKNLPSKCPCGSNFNLTHAINCHRGGFVNARHDNIRNLECHLLKTIAQDVECEPSLQHVVNKEGYQRTAILDDDARLDIRARGFWRDGQNAFFDVRVTNPDCASQQNLPLKTILRKHEQEKKRAYNRRVMEVEHGTFTPLIFTTTGVMGHECSTYHKNLAEKISEKKNERYSDIMRYVRVKFSFLALKATLLCLRGSRTLSKVDGVNTDFSLALNELGL